jgi:hypothetical protein
MTTDWHRAAGDPLDSQAEAFAREINDLLSRVLGAAPTVIARRPTDELDRWVVAPFDEDGRRLHVPLTVQGDHLADLDVSLRCRLDSRGEWLAIDASRFALKACVDRTPVIRLEYDRDAYNKPSSHLHVHAQRGALSHILSQPGHATPHAMESLHIPMGGARFRPALEDFLHLLIGELGFDSADGWQGAISDGRERWRRTQLAASVRDCAEEAVRVLTDLGYSVTEPQFGPEPVRQDRLQQW